ncbi:hypothetical protein CLD22_12120 [Rubrivivax gelatinosus]|nr:hypothetical protein [Rubrivivax gelatinosus]
MRMSSWYQFAGSEPEPVRLFSESSGLTSSVRQRVLPDASTPDSAARPVAPANLWRPVPRTK